MEQSGTNPGTRGGRAQSWALRTWPHHPTAALPQPASRYPEGSGPRTPAGSGG